MTRLLGIASAAALAMLATPALAQHHTMGPQGPANPCLLGSGAPGQCMGPVQITEQVIVTTPGGGAQAGMMQSGSVQMAHVGHSAHHGTRAPVMAPPAAGGCVPSQAAQMVRCEGNWVYSQPPVAAAPVYVPVEAPVYAPPPAPVHVPAPVAMAGIAPGSIPLSFFVGGANNGVGFNTEPTYYGGTGGFIIQSGGGTRFSGVRERSPTPLVPPRRQPRGHHGGHHGGGCGC
ncbi:MAG: hypothetical protein MUF14_10940 [Hyphomonadaceae bacterium]|jgi:hypothetical protein|nr:hypothetical protein [Hyphomonadaceae bacterium]